MPRADPPALGQGLLAVEQSVEAVQARLPHGEVHGWLARHGLEAYASPMVAQGYDKLLFLRGLDEAEVAGLIQSLKMRKPHARAFRAALAELVPAAAVAAGGAPIVGVQTATAVAVAPQPTLVIAQVQPAQVVVQASNRNRNAVSAA